MADFTASPQNVDLFTRYMMEGFDESEHIAVSTVFLPFFTSGKTLFSPDRNAVDIDIKRGNEKYAKMRLRGPGSHTIGTEIKGLRSTKFTSVSRKYPLMEDEHVIESSQLNWRSFGVSAEADRSKQAALRKLAVDGSNEIIRRMVRSQNLLARESILNGQMSAIFGTAKSDLIYDFYRHTDLTFTVATAWDNAGTVMADLDTACQRVQRNGKVVPEAFFTKGSVLTAMIENADFASKADNRRFNLIGIGSTEAMGANPVSSMSSKYQKFIDSGWIYRGWIQTTEGYMLQIFVTPDVVEEDSGTFTDMVPDGWGLVCNPFVRCDRMFGPDEKLPAIPQRVQLYEQLLGISLSTPNIPVNIKDRGALIRPDMFSYSASVNEKWTNISITVQSAPIFVTTHTDAFCTMKGLTT